MRLQFIARTDIQGRLFDATLLDKFPEIAKEMKKLLEKYSKQALGSR